MKIHRTVELASMLEDMILNGELEDGDRLDEMRLSEEFGVSRSPQREALLRFAQTYLFELLPCRGGFVRRPGLIELVQMFEAMAELEASCARLAAFRITDAALGDVRAANARCTQGSRAYL